MTAGDQATADAFDAMVTRFLAHGRDAANHLADVLDRDPGMVLALTAKGYFLKLLGRRALDPTAEASLEAARASLADRGGTDRERALVDGLAALCRGDFTGAVVAIEQSLARWPLDPLAIKLSHALRFMTGDATGMHASTTRHLRHWHRDMPDYGYMLGCHAFGLEETGVYDQAERVGRDGVMQNGDDAWGFHAVAHVMEMTDRPRDGIAWLEGHLGVLPRVNNFAYHVWWHLALFHLSLDRSDLVLDLYDQRIRAEQTDDFRDVSNAASLLWRLEAEGVAVGERWCELGEIAARHIGDHALAFADDHYVMSLVGAERGEDLARMLASIRHCSTSDVKDPHAVMTQPGVLSEVGLAVAESLCDWGAGRYAQVTRRLAPLRAKVRMIGGSHAQRDVFDQLLIEAAIRSDDGALARVLLQERLVRRPDNTWARKRLDRLEPAAA